jgi:pyroglutamyl-peptidase
MPQRVALLTGFEPYGGRGINPSALVVDRIDGERIAGATVVGRTLPVSLRPLRSTVETLIREVQPAAVVCLGLWPGEPMIRLESVGLNVADFEIPDNDGVVVSDGALQEGGAPALLATLPLARIEHQLLGAGIPARRSFTAGTFLCNATLFTALAALEAQRRAVPCGFVHLPYLPEQVAQLLLASREERKLELHQRADLTSMDLAMMVRAVRIVLETALSSP